MSDRGLNGTVRTVLIIVVLFILLGLLPVWPYSADWGIAPSGGAGLVLLVLLILLLTGRI